MARYDVIIIGTGLGGLECGFLLSKKGYNVCLIEKEMQTGGCMQTFKRNGCIFDTGFHYVGGLEEGQSLHKIFKYFGLLDLPWHKMDETGYEEIFTDNESFLYPSGHQRFVDFFSEKFPHQRKNLESYTSFLSDVGKNIFNAFEGKIDLQQFYNSMFSKSAEDFMNNTFSDEKLIRVITGPAFKIGKFDKKLPLYTFAQINESFMESAWRIKGGGSLISDSLSAQIKSMGGTILTKNKVVSLEETDGKITAAVLDNQERIEGNIFISNVHPKITLEFIKDSKSIRPAFRKRIDSLKNSSGAFTVNLKLKENHIKYLNRNLHIYESGGRIPYLFVSYAIPNNDTRYTYNIDLISSMNWEDISKWDKTPKGRRGNDYVEFKQKYAEECIDLANKYIPGLKESVDKIYTSTPLSYREYTGTEEGSAYGIEKDCERMMYTILTPATPIKNLLMTGQNLCVHGVLGVSMTSLMTCGQIPGMETVMQEFTP